MIEAQNLTKDYGDKRAVDGLTFRVEPGLVTGFLGPNGSGKSTTMRLILGLDRPTAGTVTVNGKRYLLTTQGKSSAPGGLGANQRTAKYVGGGAAVGAVLGALLGGGKGAAIGALAGGGAGAGAQVYTGRKKEIPPETELKYKLAQDLEMRPLSRTKAAPSGE